MYDKVFLRLFRTTIILMIPIILMGAIACTLISKVGDEGKSLEATASGLETTDINSRATASSEVDVNTYYVSNQGDDAADGRTKETAFETIGRVLEVVKPGETILILPGTYNETLEPESIGSLNVPITIRGEGGVAVLDGQRTLALGFWCDNCTNVILEKLEFRNYTDVGVGVLSSSDIIMRNLTVHNNGFEAQLTDWDIEGYGIDVDESQGVTIENNEVYQNGPQPQAPDRLMGTGINTFTCTDCIIRNNRSYDNVGGGILVEDGVNILVEGNQVYANDLDATAEEWWDGGLWLDGGHDVIIRDNIFRDNLGPGIQISDEDHQQPYNYVIENNVITENYYGIYLWNFGTSNFPPESTLQMLNNKITENTRQDTWIVPWQCPPPDPCN